MFRALVLAVAILLTGAHLFWMYRSYSRATEVIEANTSLRRLATLTVQHFPDHRPTAEAFWKLIGRAEPISDKWGTEFQLESRDQDGKPAFFWRSAGADRLWGTRDDLELGVPFAEGPGPDLGPPEGNTGSPAIDAK